MNGYLPHVRTPHAAIGLCESFLERACVWELYTRADLERGKPFRYSSRDFRCGAIGAGAAKALWGRLVGAGLLSVHEPGTGRRPPLITVTCQERLCSDVAIPEHNGSTTGAQRERNWSAESNEQKEVSVGAGSTTGAQREHNGSATGALNARADNNLQPPTSNLQEQEEEQQPAQQPLPEPEPPAAAASESGKPDDPVQAVWEQWEPKRVEVYGGRVGKLTKARRSAMRARIKDHSVEEVAMVVEWWLTSSHDRAVFLRSKGCTWDTVLRPSNFPGYLEMAGQAVDAMRQRALPTGSDQTERTALEAIAKMRALYADHGSLPYDKMPPAIVGALREIGGIRYLFGAVNDFQQRDRTNAFVAAYRRHAAGTENG